MSHIFISHSVDEHPLAGAVLDALAQRWPNAWYDKQMRAGAEWQGQICRWLLTCDLAVVLCSRKALSRPWVQFEVQTLYARAFTFGRPHVVMVPIDGPAADDVLQPEDIRFAPLDVQRRQVLVLAAETRTDAARIVEQVIDHVGELGLARGDPRERAWVGSIEDTLRRTYDRDSAALGGIAEALARRRLYTRELHVAADPAAIVERLIHCTLPQIGKVVGRWRPIPTPEWWKLLTPLHVPLGVATRLAQIWSMGEAPVLALTLDPESDVVWEAAVRCLIRRATWETRTLRVIALDDEGERSELIERAPCALLHALGGEVKCRERAHKPAPDRVCAQLSRRQAERGGTDVMVFGPRATRMTVPEEVSRTFPNLTLVLCRAERAHLGGFAPSRVVDLEWAPDDPWQWDLNDYRQEFIERRHDDAL